MEIQARKVDVCVVCALPEEARAFLEVMQQQCKGAIEKRSSPRYHFSYRFATIKNNKDEPLNLHISWLPRYGPQEMTLHLSRILEECQPRIAIMTGICAGDAEHVELGDLVVAERTFTYDNGKFTLDEHGRSIHLHDTLTYQLSANILQFLGLFDEWKPLVARLKRPLYPSGQRKRRKITCHIRAMASGSAVRADNPFEDIRAPVRGTVAIDMEGAAFCLVMSRYLLIPWLVVKGVCDYADQDKKDIYHGYAARASALYALSFIQAYITDEQLHRLDGLSSRAEPSESNMTAFTNRELVQLHQRPEILPAVRQEFVGRHAETALFNDALSSAGKPILFFHGIGGIGKSWLINWLIMHCQSERTALVDFSEASHLDFLTIMIAIRDQISHKSFKRFNAVLEKYDFIRQAQGIEALKLLKTLDQSAFQKQHPDNDGGIYSVTRYLSVSDSERSRILQKAKEEMTISFQADLLDLTGDGKCVLFFDTIERIDTDTGNWLQKDFLSRLVASPSKNLLLVLAGRKESLWASLAREWYYSIAERELKNFNQMEVEEYLLNRSLVEPGQQISQLIYKFTAGHPLCVGLAADLLEEYTQQGDELDITLMQAYKWDVNSEIISSFLTQRILDRLPPTLTKLIMLCSITHWFDASIIRQLSDASESFHKHSNDYLEATKKFSFVRPYFKGTRGYTFHEVVRRFLLLKLRRDDPDLFHTLNERALRYFEQELERAEARLKSELIVERIYHLLVVDEDAGMTLFSEMFEYFDKLCKKDICKRLIDVATEHEWDEDAEKKWTELLRMLK